MLLNNGFLACIAIGVLSACSTLPNVGPRADSFADEELQQPSATQQGFIVADLDAQLLTVLNTRHAPSFKSLRGHDTNPGSYVVGVGDVLQVTIWEAAGGGLFSGPSDAESSASRSVTLPSQEVDFDRSITIPYVGRVAVAGLTLSRIEEAIVEGLFQKAIEPQAVVTLVENASNAVTVSGDGIQGARIALSRAGDRLLDVLAKAGGITTPTFETEVTITRQSRVLTVPFQRVIETPSENILIRKGDVITVSQVKRTFTALGATGQNTIVPFDSGKMTLERAVAMAGGLNSALSNPSGVFLLRREPLQMSRKIAPDFSVPPQETMANVVYTADLRNPNVLFLAAQFDVMPDDILYVASAPANEWTSFLRLFALGVGTADGVSGL